MPDGLFIFARTCVCTRGVYHAYFSLSHFMVSMFYLDLYFLRRQQKRTMVLKSLWWREHQLSFDDLFSWLGCNWLNIWISVWSLENSLSRCRTRKDKTWTSTSPGSGMRHGFLSLYLIARRRFLMQNFFCCSSATNRLITSKDHASVQINIGHLGPDGVYTNQFTSFALCGFIRAQVPLLPFT